MRKRQTGVATVEFALASVILFSVLLGILDFGRILFTWNAVAESTRWGARQAVVCDQGDSAVLVNMRKILPILTSATVTIDWYDNAGKISSTCDHTNCAGVAVSVTGLSISPLSPLTWIGFSSLSAPGFSTYLTREIMGQDPGSSAICDIGA